MQEGRVRARAQSSTKRLSEAHIKDGESYHSNALMFLLLVGWRLFYVCQGRLQDTQRRLQDSQGRRHHIGSVQHCTCVCIAKPVVLGFVILHAAQVSEDPSAERASRLLIGQVHVAEMAF